MKSNLILSLASLFILAGCNYRVFDLAQYPELQGSLPNGAFGNKMTESHFDSIFVTVVQDKCLGCHKPGGKAEALSLRNYKEMMDAMTDAGEPLIVPGKPDESLFYTALLPTAKKMMPPRKSNLAPVEKERTDAIKAWILAGALEKNPVTE